MIRKFSLLLALMMLLAVQVSANEFTNDAYAIYVESMQFVTGPAGERQIAFTLPNMGQDPIDAVAIDIVMLDDSLQPVLAAAPDAFGFGKETKAGDPFESLVYSQPLQPGASGQYVHTIGPEYEKATRARAAIIYYRRATGEEFHIAPQGMLWNSTDGIRMEPEVPGKFYPGLTKEQADLAFSFPMGFNSEARILQDALAPAYGQKEGGLWVLEITEGGLAQRVGLQAGDLLVSVDGVRLADDPRAIELGKIKMAQGSAVEYVWVRGGETMRGEITKD